MAWCGEVYNWYGMLCNKSRIRTLVIPVVLQGFCHGHWKLWNTIEVIFVKQKNVRQLVSSIFYTLFVETMIDRIFEMFCYLEWQVRFSLQKLFLTFMCFFSPHSYTVATESQYKCGPLWRLLWVCLWGLGTATSCTPYRVTQESIWCGHREGRLWAERYGDDWEAVAW